MEEGYYVPNIEEFHVGFEYEYLGNKSTGVTGWDKRVAFEGKGSFADNYMMQIFNALKENKIRVKYLCKEDIESIVHKNTKDFHTIFKLREQYTNELCFQTYWIEEGDWLDEEYIYWDTKYNTFKITHKSKALFSGTIKNKSELKKLLEQLNID